LQSAFKKAGVFPIDRNAVSENAQLEVEINCDNIRCASFEFPEAIVNDEETDIVSYVDINEIHASVTLNQKECGDFFTSKEDQLKAVKSEEEENKKRRNTMGRVVSGRAVTENGVA
jgi:hypothetical protein